MYYCTQLFSNQPNKTEIKIKGDKSSKGIGTKREKPSLILQNGTASQAKKLTTAPFRKIQQQNVYSVNFFFFCKKEINKTLTSICSCDVLPRISSKFLSRLDFCSTEKDKFPSMEKKNLNVKNDNFTKPNQYNCSQICQERAAWGPKIRGHMIQVAIKDRGLYKQVTMEDRLQVAIRDRLIGNMLQRTRNRLDT
jgi:hypothetical protein